jgi:hypothetical protein
MLAILFISDRRAPHRLIPRSRCAINPSLYRGPGYHALRGFAPGTLIQ